MARGAGFLDECGIDHAQGKARGRRAQGGLLREQAPTQRLQPVLAFAQALKHRHVGEFGEFRRPRAHRRLAQQIAAHPPWVVQRLPPD